MASTGLPLVGTLAKPQTLNAYSYVANNPLRYNDPTGEGPKEFFQGLSNAILSNAFMGAGRQQSSDSDFQSGQRAGDVVSIVTGSFEAAVGIVATVGGAAGGIVTSPTGAGAVVGGAVSVEGVAITAHGYSTAAAGAYNFFQNSNNNRPNWGSKVSTKDYNSVKGDWFNTTFGSKRDTIGYHYDTHVTQKGINKSVSQYTQDAKNLFANYKDQGRAWQLGDGSTGLKINMPNGQGGIYTQSGKIVTFWYSK